MKRATAPAGELLDLVSSIYDAALQPDGSAWAGVLEQLRQKLSASSAFMFTPFVHPMAGGLWQANNIPGSFFKDYAEHFIDIDVWEAAVRTSVRRGGCITDEAILSFTELKRTEWFADGLRPLDISRLMANVVSDDSVPGTPRTYMSFYRPIGAEPFTQKELKLYRTLSPHLQRANDVFWRLRGAEMRHQGDLAVLDRLAAGVVLLDAAGEVLYANRAAQQALRRNDGLTMRQRHLVAARSAQSSKLFRAIAQVCRTNSGDGEHAGGFLAVDRPSGEPPWSLLIAPLPAKPAPWLSTRIPAAVVFINESEAQPATGGAMLTHVFGLTPAEARLAAALAEGLSLADAAERHEITRETARTLLKRVFDKTGTHRQAALVRLMLGRPPSDPPPA